MKARLYAFLIHLTLSALIAALSMLMVFAVWYPIPLNKAIGVTDIYLLLLAVDITIGPILTLVVFKPKKPGLKMDLIIIIALQLAALSYGMFTVFEGRPVFVVFNQDRFDTVRQMDIDPASAQKALQENNASAIIGWFRPRWVAAIAPTDSKRATEILFSAVVGGADWAESPELYVPLEQLKAQMLKKARSMQELRELAAKTPGSEELSNIQDNQLKWLPLHGKAKNMAVLIDADSSKVLRVVDVNPWP